MSIEEQIAVARAEERERCAKAIEDDAERVFATGCPSLGEMCIYEVCAIIVRGLDRGPQN